MKATTTTTSTTNTINTDCCNSDNRAKSRVKLKVSARMVDNCSVASSGVCLHHLPVPSYRCYAANSGVAKSETKQTTMATTRTVVRATTYQSSISTMYILLLCFSLCFTVISSSRFVPSEQRQSRQYSQYYPPYDTNSQSDHHHQQYVGQPLDHSLFHGGEITGLKVLTRSGQSDPSTPDYTIHSDILIPANSRLEIESGVRIAFTPQVGITVRGALLANVSCES